MITPAERAYITEQAYVPEHLPHYVTAIAQTEPFLIGNFVVHVAGQRLVFVGYPLSGNGSDEQLLASLAEAKARFRPTVVSIIAPALPAALNDYSLSPPDAYYRLDLTQLRIPQKTRNMLARARREVTIRVGSFGKEHKRLIEDFLRRQPLDDATRFIFQRVPEYVKCDTALVFEARTARGDLVAFDVAELGARQYAFYMFNFRSRQHNIPGASDLLLAQIIAHAQAEGKRYLNLGLGINAGVTFFKTKWGGVPFLNYVAGVQESRASVSWSDLFDRLARL